MPQTRLCSSVHAPSHGGRQAGKRAVKVPFGIIIERLPDRQQKISSLLACSSPALLDLSITLAPALLHCQA